MAELHGNADDRWFAIGHFNRDADSAADGTFGRLDGTRRHEVNENPLPGLTLLYYGLEAGAE